MIPFRNTFAAIIALVLLISPPLKAQNDGIITEQSAAEIENTESAEKNEETIPQPKPARLGRALLETGLVIVAGMAWYYYDNSNKRDRLLESKEDILKNLRIVSVLKFDDNVYETNAVAHPGAGALYYLAGRTNGFNQWQSFCFALGGSAFWEYIVEFREIISINDMIQTPFGGWIIGESLFQLAAFYAANSSPNWLHDFISGRVDVAKYRYTQGLNQPFHNAILYAGVYGQVHESFGVNLGMDMELYSVKKLKQSGRLDQFFFDTPYSRTVITSSFGTPRGLTSLFLFAEAGLFGYAKQAIHYADGKKSGYSVFLSLNSAFSYNNLVTDDFHNKVGMIHLLGSAADISLIKNDFTLRLRSSLFGDFAQVQSAGLKKYYNAGHSAKDVENMGALTTANTGYYFAYGATYRQLATADYKTLQLGLELTYSRFYSINGDGRTNDAPRTYNNFKMKDIRITPKGWFEVKTGDHSAVRLAMTYSYLRGSADTYVRRLHDTKYELNMLYRI